MATWSNKDKAADEEAMRDQPNLGMAANLQQFEREDYTGPSWNAFTEAWTWIKEKMKRR
jgi:hypothetical protein